MFRSRKKLYATIVLAIAFAALAAVYLTTGVTALTNQPDKPAGDRHQDEGPSVRLSPDEIRRADIKIERVQPEQFADTLAAFGTIGANRNSFARVASPVAGRLVKVAVDLGAQASSGETLAILESPELAEIRAAYLQGRTELDLTRAELDRAEKLAVDRSISQKDLLRARADHERARAALTALEGKLATLGVAATAPAGSPAAFLAVAAPFAGTVVERTAVLGEYAQARDLYEQHLPQAISRGLARLGSSLLADLAWCRVNIGQREQALEQARESELELDPACDVDDRAATHSRLAQIYRALGQDEAAARHEAQAEREWAELSRQQQRWSELLEGAGLTRPW